MFPDVLTVHGVVMGEAANGFPLVIFQIFRDTCVVGRGTHNWRVCENSLKVTAR